MVFAQKSERNFHRENNPTPENENIKTKSQVRLPKHELKTSDGNALNWQSFWDRFDSSNLGNIDLNGIDKFSYLQYFLCFSESESGLTAIAENYTEAINILHERYGNTWVQIIALVNYFMSPSCEKYEQCNVSGLPNLIDKLKSSVRNLESLKVDPSSYGILLRH